MSAMSRGRRFVGVALRRSTAHSYVDPACRSTTPTYGHEERTAPRRRPGRAGRHARSRRARSTTTDLAPVPLSRRNWTTYNYAALWISMAHCIPTYMLASGLMAVGHELVAGAHHDPARQHDRARSRSCSTRTRARSTAFPFPVFARAAYGTLGSNLPALMRALVACGWFGIQAWIGGEALHTFFKAIIPGWPTLLGAGLRRPHDDRVAVVPALLGPQHLHHLSRHGPAARRSRTGPRRSCW